MTMKKIELEELRALQLNILQAVHDFCSEHSIRYSLSGGTLIGAVRHKGYIPWDDDIDIMMPRPDYENFCLLFNSENNRFQVVNSFNTKEFFQPFSKVSDTFTILNESYDRPIANLGVNIDVFPIDGLPNNEKKRNRYWKVIKIKKKFSTFIYEKKNDKERGLKKIIRLCFFFILKPFPANTFAKRLHKIGMKNNFIGSTVIANSIFGYGRKEEMPGNLFDSFIDIKFEGRRFKAVEQWNTYLTNIFGDYMKLPPKNERLAKHEFDAYFKEQIYE